MTRQRVFLCRAILVLTVLGPSHRVAFSQGPVLWGDLKPGHYLVGFKVLERYDTSRRWQTEGKGRPIQISVWYPSDGVGNGPALTYRDYFLLSANETDFTKLTNEKKTDAVAQYATVLLNNGIPRDAVDALLSARMYAVPDFEVAKGSFPLLIVAQGNFHSAHHQSVLCEFLSSHGYIVATSPSQTRISGPMKGDEDVYPNIVEQSEDIAFLKTQVVKAFAVDTGRIGLLAHSFGARSAFFYVADNRDVKALVSLDGGIGNKQGKGFMDSKRGFDPGTIQVPILHFYEDIESFMTPDFELIHSLRNCDRFLIRVEQMHHNQFTSFGMAGGTIPGFSDNAAETKVKCEAIYTTTLRFVDAFVGNRTSDSGARFQKSTRELLPNGLMHCTRIGSSQDAGSPE